MLYELAKPLLFALDPETAHRLSLSQLGLLGRLCSAPLAVRSTSPVTLMGLPFPNRIGLAAGLDKDGEAIDGLARYGFGHIEVGTVTPRPQPGNPRPRLFRLPAAQAIINRMGFNNHGVDALVESVRKARYRGILGINIGKNFDTPIARAADDYRIGLEKVYAVASYVTVNISSPNTANLRQLQGANELESLLTTLKTTQTRLADQTGRYVPLVLKIAPDLDHEQIDHIAQALIKHRMDGVIATNTTLARDRVAGLPFSEQQGGLSGAPLFEAATEVLAHLVQRLDSALPVIAAGGVMNAAQAKAKLQAGAQLVQLYTGFIYHGPALVKACVDACTPTAITKRDAS